MLKQVRNIELQIQHDGYIPVCHSELVSESVCVEMLK